MAFRGQGDHSIDSKGRVAIPAKMRAALPETSGGRFVAYSGRDAGIKLYAVEEWARIEAEAADLNRFRLDNLQVTRKLFMMTEDLDLDGQGRVMLSKKLLKHAGLAPGDVATVIGAGDRIEIWHPDALAASLNETEDDADALFDRTLGGL